MQSLAFPAGSKPQLDLSLCTETTMHHHDDDDDDDNTECDEYLNIQIKHFRKFK